MRHIARGIELLSSGAGLVVSLAVLLMMLASVAEVSRRKFLGTSFVGTIEFVELLVVLAFFMGMSYTQARKGHLRMELVVARLPERARVLIEAGVLLLALAFYALMLSVAWKAAAHSWAIREFRFGAMPFPIWPAKLGVAIGLLLLCFQLSVHVIEGVARSFGRHRG